MIESKDTIGDWTVQQLIQFLTAQREENPPVTTSLLTCDEFVVYEKAIFNDVIQLLQQQTTVGAAGGATALPATPLGYFKAMTRTGKTVVVPFYNA